MLRTGGEIRYKGQFSKGYIVKYFIVSIGNVSTSSILYLMILQTMETSLEEFAFSLKSVCVKLYQK